MSHQLFLTDLGKQKLAQLSTTGQGNPLTITEFVVGAGKDVDFSKRLDRQTLVAKKYQTAVQDVVQLAPNQYEIACVVPHDVGGFAIREIGLIADDGTLMWVGSLPEVQKPTTDSLSAVDYRINCIVSIDDANITLTVDGNVITATKKWVIDTVGDSVKTEIEKIREQLERQRIPIGGLFATTKHYANGEAVTAELGYGKWMRALIGRTGVGFNPNANDWTATMGQQYGEKTHTLTIDEMPSHNHTKKDYDSIDDNSASYEIDKMHYGNPGTGTFQGIFQTNHTGGSRPHNNIQPSQVIAYWQRLPDDYVPPVYRVYWTSDEQGNRQISQINEGQKVFLWIEVANLTTPQPIGAVIDGDKHDSISIAGGCFNFPETIDNGKTKLGEFAPTALSKDMTISMGISLPNDEQVLAKLMVKNQIHEIGRRTTTLPLVIQRQNYGDSSTDMIQLPYIIATASSADDEDYNPEFVEFDSNGNRRLSNNNANQAGFYPSGSIGERIGKSFTAMSNPRLHDIWFYVPATQPIKHVGITSSQPDLFGYRVERYTGVYNGLYSDNVPEAIRNQSKDWIILRANDEPDKTINLIRQAQNKNLDIHIDF